MAEMPVLILPDFLTRTVVKALRCPHESSEVGTRLYGIRISIVTAIGGRLQTRSIAGVR